MKKAIIFMLMSCLSTMVFAQTFNANGINTGTTDYLLGIDFTSDLVGCTVGQAGNIRTTTNGGQTWTPRTSGVTRDLYALDFADANTGFAGGDGMTFTVTANGGVDWDAENIPSTIFPANTNLDNFNIRRIVAFDANRVYVAVAAASGFPSDGFLLRRTTDANGIITWANLYTSPESLYGLFVHDNGNGRTIWTSGANGLVASSTNEGATPFATLSPLGTTTSVLQAIHVVRDVTPNAIICTGATSIALPSNGIVVRSTDDGANWINISANNPAFDGQYLTDIAFWPNSQIGYTVGGSASANAIYRTADAGATWTRDNTSPNSARLYRLSLPSCNVGYISGLNGTLLRSTANTLTAPNVSVCPKATAILSASGTNIDSYTWFNGVQNSSTNVAFPTSGTYGVTATFLSGCTASASPTLTVLSAPTVSIAGNGLICQGTSTTLTASGSSGTYLWSTGATTPSITVSPSVNTTYTVTLRNESGCSSSADFLVKVNPTPILDNSPVSMCSGVPYTFHANALGQPNPNATYQWRHNTNPTIIGTTEALARTHTIGSVASSTYYTVTARDTITNCSATATRLVTINPAPTVTITNGSFPTSPITICAGSSITLSATNGFDNYDWSIGTNPAFASGSSSNVTVSPTASTTYRVVARNSVGCFATASRVVGVSAPFTISLPNRIICSGASTTIGVVHNYQSYTWTSNPATTSLPTASTTASQITVSPTTNTIYTLVAQKNGCEATASCTVTVTPSPPLTLTIPCYSGSPVTVTAAFSGTLPSFSWTNPATGNITTGNNVTITPSNIPWTVAASNSEGCRTSTSFSVLPCFAPDGLAVPGETELDETESFDGSSETTSTMATLAAANINTLQIAPNPTDNQFNLSLEFNETQDASVFIQDLTGRILQQRNFGQVKMIQDTFTLADLPSGMYLLVVRSEKGLLTTAKIIKE